MSYFAYRFARKESYRNQICFSAERSIYIGPDGNAIPCCFNRNTVYGNILSAPYSDIENSPIRIELKEKLRRNDFSMGCHYCRQAIESKNYKAAGSLTYDLPWFRKRHFPCFMEFELDTFCNLDCRMCPPELHSRKPGEVNEDIIIQTIQPLLSRLQWAKFYGGEPFLIKSYYRIWNEIIKSNARCRIIVQTNGTVLNGTIKELLNAGNFRLSVSIDSLNPENYERIRKGAHFENTWNNLLFFIEHSHQKKKPLNLSVCPMTDNLQDIPELIQFALKNRLYLYFNLLQYPRQLSPKYMPPEELRKRIDEYKKLRIPSWTIRQREVKMHFLSLIRQLELWQKISSERIRIPASRISSNELIRIIISRCEHPSPEMSDKLNTCMRFLPDFLSIKEDTFRKMKEIPGSDIRKFVDANTPEKLAEMIRDAVEYDF